MGALVEILRPASGALQVFTDEKGHYSLAGLLPGNYTIKVSMPSFMPALKERIGIRPGSTQLVNFTLSTIFDVLQLVPGNPSIEEDEWKWTLRSVENRPILRAVDPSVVLAEKKDTHPLKGSVSFLAGSNSGGFGSSSDMSTGFSIEHSLFSSGTVALKGNVGYGGAVPATVLRASYAHQMPSGSRPEVAFTARRFESPGSNLPVLQALALSAGDTVTLGDFVELNFGSELQSVQFMGRVNAFRPFGSADVHLSPNTIVEYRYATSIPNSRLDKGFDSSPADFTEANPRVSMASFTPTLERAHHSEVSVSRRMGKTSVQFATFFDRISNTALIGVGDMGTDDTGEILPDIYSGTFTYRGSTLDTSGLRAVLQRKLTSDLTATLDYSYGGVLDLSEGEESLANARASLHTVSRHALAGKMSGTIPGAKTHWITSYRWTSGEALTPVDLFNASPGQADPYFNVFVRQPIPHVGFLNVKMEAVLEIRNLMAQGYVPMLASDGHTVYLVQSARAVRGGVAFNF
jgi:hypothetical protein